jgi:MFS family permease
VLFTNRRFTGTNLVTLGLYAALSSALFILVVRLQNELHYSPLAAGVATVPVTLLMLAGSDLAGRISNKIGPQIPLTAGPLVAGLGLAWLGGVAPGTSYLTGVLPPLVVFGLGLTFVVAPLTATVLAAAPDELAGIASGINNAIARTGGLLGVAVVPLLAGGISGTAYRYTMWITGGMAVVSGVIGFVSLVGTRPAPAPAPAPAAGVAGSREAPAEEAPAMRPVSEQPLPREFSCGAGAPPMRPGRTAGRV